MREDDTTGRAAHPAEPGLPGQCDATDAVDDLWCGTRTDAPHAVVPAHDDVRRWAWQVRR